VSRPRWIGLLTVVAAVLAALAVSAHRTSPAQLRQVNQTLAPLRTLAALGPCPTSVSRALPKLTLSCLGGGPRVALNGQPSGKPTLVNIYASWCPPCIEELPLLVRFSRASAGRIALLGVDTEDEQRRALILAHQVGQTWPAVVDDNKSLLTHYAGGPPVTLFIDGHGKIVYVRVKKFDSYAQLQGLAQRYLGVAA
jgi:cytochrome c biogenesis protein CcmG/thiol:disulfide interchange protein DsbE